MKGLIILFLFCRSDDSIKSINHITGIIQSHESIWCNVEGHLDLTVQNLASSSELSAISGVENEVDALSRNGIDMSVITDPSGIQRRTKAHDDTKENDFTEKDSFLSTIDKREVQSGFLTHFGAKIIGSYSCSCSNLCFTHSHQDCLFSIFVFVSASLVESPFAIIEGFVRCCWFLFLSVMVVISIPVFGRKYILHCSFLLIREALLNIAASISLCVPFLVCYVYRNYRADTDWKLSPIPTIFGWVDARRFIAFTYGNGSLAANVRYDYASSTIGDSTDNSDGDEKSSIEKYNNVDGRYSYREKDIKSTTTENLDEQNLVTNRQQSDDTWEGYILCEPRKVESYIVRIVRGEDPFGICEE